MNSISALGNAYYGPDSFQLELPVLEPTLAKTMLYNLRENNWVDESTQEITVATNLYNINTHTLLQLKVIFEFTPAGGIRVSTTISTAYLTLYRYLDTAEIRFWVLVIADIWALGVAGANMYSMITQLVMYGWEKYLGTAWNIIDMVLLVAILLTQALRLVFEIFVV